MKRAGIMSKLLVFAVIGLLVWTIIGQQGNIVKANARRSELKAQSAAVELENDEIKRRISALIVMKRRAAVVELENDKMRQQIDNSASDEIIADIAREELGFEMPGEQVIATN